jgi:hypothetical protein
MYEAMFSFSRGRRILKIVGISLDSTITFEWFLWMVEMCILDENFQRKIISYALYTISRPNQGQLSSQARGS